MAHDPLLHVGQLLDQPVHLLQDRQPALHEGPPQRSRHQPARMALEQRAAQRTLQVAQAPARGGQHEMAFTGRRRQAARAGAGDGQADRDEVEAGEVVGG
jgi:hypothetical protein